MGAQNWRTCEVRPDGSGSCVPWRREQGEPRPLGGKFISVSIGYSYACGVKTDGAVACWGSVDFRDDYGQRLPPRVFASVTTGSRHSCGVTHEGSVHCWGRTSSPAPPGNREVPVANVEGIARSISAGDRHLCVLESDGSVSCSLAGPRKGAASVFDEKFVAMDTGGGVTCGLRADGIALCWVAGSARSRGRRPPTWSRSAPVMSMRAGCRRTAPPSVGVEPGWPDDRTGRQILLGERWRPSQLRHQT